MDQEERFARERTYYDEYPDYTRPALEMPRGFRERVLGRLEFLYSPETAENWMPELERILKVHHAHKPPEMIEKEQEYDPEQRFCQEHIMLITYGDMVRWVGPTPLSVLHRFVTQYAGGGINMLHLLPFFPYSSDRGFAVIDFRRVDERLGSWKDMRGVPGIYIHGALGTANDYGAAKASGFNRDLNRGMIDAWEVEKVLKDPASKLSLLFSRGREQILVRRRERSFHPQCGQKVLYLSHRVFALLRTSPEGDEAILTLTSVTAEAVGLTIPLDEIGFRHGRYRDLLSRGEYEAEVSFFHITLPPYGRIWLKNEE